MQLCHSFNSNIQIVKHGETWADVRIRADFEILTANNELRNKSCIFLKFEFHRKTSLVIFSCMKMSGYATFHVASPKAFLAL